MVNGKNKNYILFDLDGTLTDSHEGIIKSVQYALLDAGIQEDNIELMKKYIGPPLIDSFQQFHKLDFESAQKAVEKYRERYNVKGLYENKLIDGMENCVKTLKAEGKKIALATCKPEMFTGRIMDYFNLTSYFDVIVGSSLDETRRYKYQVIEEVFRQFSIKDPDFTKEQAIMIGDRKDDVLGAKKTGIECIGVKFGFAEAGELEKAGADYVVNTVNELTELVLKL